MAERQSARMLKITNDGLTRSGTAYFIAVPILATVGVKGLKSRSPSIEKILSVRGCDSESMLYEFITDY